MLLKRNNTSIDQYSLDAIFHIYKEHKDDRFLSEIYKRTHDHLFDIVYPKVSTSKEACLIVQEVYRIIRTSLHRYEREECIYSYLTRIADGCLVHYSYKLLQA